MIQKLKMRIVFSILKIIMMVVMIIQNLLIQLNA